MYWNGIRIKIRMKFKHEVHAHRYDKKYTKGKTSKIDEKEGALNRANTVALN